MAYIYSCRFVLLFSGWSGCETARTTEGEHANDKDKNSVQETLLTSAQTESGSGGPGTTVTSRSGPVASSHDNDQTCLKQRSQ